MNRPSEKKVIKVRVLGRPKSGKSTLAALIAKLLSDHGLDAAVSDHDHTKAELVRKAKAAKQALRNVRIEVSSATTARGLE